ncbi:MAG: RNA polymerase subunit sigma-70, partial [Rhodothermales bacterium]|nr:RNA polymerase subunit sigma-70 [Rhodothermales bacterium]
QRFEGAHETMNTTALIHEVYLKFDRAGNLVANDRSHFLLIASRAMRQLLIGYARRRKRQKRGGGEPIVTFGPDAERDALVEQQGARLVDINRALSRLESMDERLGKVAELLLFGGLTYEEAAEVLDVGRATVSRDWRVARALLTKELEA